VNWAIGFVGGPHDGLEGHTVVDVPAGALPPELRLYDAGEGVEIFEPALWHMIPAGADVAKYLKSSVNGERERAVYSYADPNKSGHDPWVGDEEDAPRERELAHAGGGGHDERHL
jgi:hypothetical protein